MEENMDIIELTDDLGGKFTFEHLLTFDVDDDYYIAITPVEDNDDFKVGEVLIMRIQQDEKGESYVPIESEDELDMLWDIFQQLYYEEEEEDEHQHGD